MIRTHVTRLAKALPAALLVSISLAATAAASATATADEPTLEVTMTAELEQVQARNGRVTVLLLPAEHVVPGDSLIYTLQVRNTGSVAIPVPQFTAPIPRHTNYVPGSAVAPGADVLYSVDAGLTFDKPQNLRVPGEGGALQAATPADYTHIRWILRHSLNANSVVYARFRARLN